MAFRVFDLMVLIVSFCNVRCNSTESSISEFHHIGDGIRSDWRALNSRLTGERFQVDYGDSKLWVVGAFSASSYHIRDRPSLSQGGVVSSFDINERRWTHKLYENVQPTANDGTTFVMNKQLYMLTYSTNLGPDPLRGIFVWRDNAWQQSSWNVQTYDVSMERRMSCADVIADWTDYQSYKLYVTASCRNYDNAPMPMVYTVRQLVSTQMPSGTLIGQPVYNFQIDEPFSFITTRDCFTLFVTSRSNRVTLFHSKDSDIFTDNSDMRRLNCTISVIMNMDRRNLESIKYPNCPGLIDNPKGFQIINDLLVFGRGTTNKIYRLNLSSKEWSEVDGEYDGQGEVAVDRMTKTIYTVSIIDGVRKSDLSL